MYMQNENSPKKEIIKKVSSGGFIFYRDKVTFQVYVLLIQHTNGEIWIPNGKLEGNETQIDAAFREIKEEVGFDYDQLKYIDLCATDSYSYDMDETHIMNKDLFINVFSVENKIEPNPTDWKDLAAVNWYTYTEALEVIAFNKKELEIAYGMFIKSINQVNRLVTIGIEKIKSQIQLLPCASNISAIYLYGSIYKEIHRADIHDTDMTIVIKDDTVDISELFDLLHTYFEQMDFHLYTETEIEHDLSFFTRGFVVEYITKGLCIYGDNILEKYNTSVSKEKYRQSIFIRSMEYVQLVRRVYYSFDHNFDYKISYLKKYTTRLARCVILMKGYATWDELERLTPNQILRILYDNKHLSLEYSIYKNDLEKPIEYYYRILCEIATSLHTLRKDLF